MKLFETDEASFVKKQKLSKVFLKQSWGTESDLRHFRKDSNTGSRICFEQREVNL